MLGFSFSKIIFTAIAILVVMYGYRWLSQFKKRVENNNIGARSRQNKHHERNRSTDGSRDSDDISHVETMVECKICGSFVATGSTHHCVK